MSQMAPSSPPPQPDSPQPELPQSPAAPPGSKMGVLPVPGFLKGKTKMMAIVLAISGIVSVVGSALWIWHVIKPPQVGIDDHTTHVHISWFDFKMMCAFTVVISWLSTSFAVAGMLLKERWVYRTYVFLAIYQSILMLVLMFAFVFVAAAAGGSLGKSYLQVIDTWISSPDIIGLRRAGDYLFKCKNLDDYLQNPHRADIYECCWENPTTHVYCYSSTQKAIIEYYRGLYDYLPCDEHDFVDQEHRGNGQDKFHTCRIENDQDVYEHYRKLALGSGIFMVLFSFFSIVCKLLTAFLASVVARSLGPTALVATNSVSYPS